ncbi:MAG: hypothetical protein K6F67_07625 [Oscillospiraceae bacterium]|nr:hypothetical protein [Oscillospiraceae bacterium]
MPKSCGIIGDGALPFRRGSPPWDALADALARLVRESGCEEFISGMERGGDQLGAEVVLGLREELGLKLWGVLSSEEQWIHWPNVDADRLFSLMERSDYEYRIANHAAERSRSDQLLFIADNSQKLIVIAAELSPEARAAVVRAAARGSAVTLIDPVTLRVSSAPSVVR